MGASLALPTIPVSAFIQFQQVLHLSYVKFMPVFLIAASVSNLLWLFLLRKSVRSPGFVLLALATVGILFVFAITLMVNVPINKELMTWDASAPLANVLELWKPWEQVNTIRTIVAVCVFALEALVLSLATVKTKV